MKSLFILLTILLFSTAVLAQDDKNAPKKTYTEEELEAEVNKRLTQKLDSMKSSKLVEFSKELLEKERLLKLKEIELNRVKEQLSLNTRDFEQRVKEFNQKQQSLISCLDANDKKKGERISHMVDVISGMRPQNAADVLSVQDTDISVKILGLLAPEKVSKIFNLMDKEISARLQKQYMNMKK